MFQHKKMLNNLVNDLTFNLWHIEHDYTFSETHIPIQKPHGDNPRQLPRRLQRKPLQIQLQKK